MIFLDLRNKIHIQARKRLLDFLIRRLIRLVIQLDLLQDQLFELNEGVVLERYEKWLLKLIQQGLWVRSLNLTYKELDDLRNVLDLHKRPLEQANGCSAIFCTFVDLVEELRLFRWRFPLGLDLYLNASLIPPLVRVPSIFGFKLVVLRLDLALLRGLLSVKRTFVAHEL